MTNVRRMIAEWLCPEMAREAQRYWYITGDLDAAARWLGAEFKDAQAVIEWLRDNDHYMFVRAAEAAGLSTWNRDINGFREQLRARAKAVSL